MAGLGRYLEVRIGEQRKQLCQSTRLGGQTSLGLTFFRLLSSSSNWRIRMSFVVSSSFSRRSSSCCRKNIRRSYAKKENKKQKQTQPDDTSNEVRTTAMVPLTSNSGNMFILMCTNSSANLSCNWDLTSHDPQYSRTLLAELKIPSEALKNKQNKNKGGGWLYCVQIHKPHSLSWVGHSPAGQSHSPPHSSSPSPGL